ncbi:MAG: alpha/beta hydrolase [Beijerinckiaceae bacterium]|nr:alpha/beta hydrolase [Beijerinckiaceae bacterium]
MTLKLWLAVAVLVYVAAAGVIFLFQRALLYFPDHLYLAPSEIKTVFPFRELPVATEDGLALTGWYAAAKSRPYTIVFFHGNGDSLRTIAFIANPYLAAGYGFFLAEYRGYSGMPGSPSETGLYADGRAFIEKLISSGIDASKLIFMGYSLGTGVATQMACEFNAAGLLLMAPFLSVAKMAQIRFPVFPASLLTLDRYENFRKVPDLRLPILIAHGGRDGVIPQSQGRRLFELANEPKQFYFAPLKDHTNIFDSDFIAFSLNWLETIGAQSSNSKRPAQ